MALVLGKNSLFSENLFNTELSTGYNTNILDESNGISSLFNKISAFDKFHFKKIPLEFTLYTDLTIFDKSGLSNNIYINTEINYKHKNKFNIGIGGIIFRDSNEDYNSYNGVYSRLLISFAKLNVEYKFLYKSYTSDYEYDSYILDKFFKKIMNMNKVKIKILKKPMIKKLLLTALSSKKEQDYEQSIKLTYSKEAFSVTTTTTFNNSNFKEEKYYDFSLEFNYNFFIKNLNFDLTLQPEYIKYYKVNRKDLLLFAQFSIIYPLSEKLYLGCDINYTRDDSNQKGESFTKYVSSVFIGFDL